MKLTKKQILELRQEKIVLGYKIVRGDITDKERERIAEINKILAENPQDIRTKL